MMPVPSFLGDDNVSSADAHTAWISLSGTDWVATPDASALDITGDIDLRAKIRLASWTPSGGANIIQRWSNTAAHQAYTLGVGATGYLSLTVYTGSYVTLSSAAPLGFAANATRWIRATRVASTGVWVLYTSRDGVNWTTVGSGTGTAGSIHASTTTTLRLGAFDDGNGKSACKVYYADVRSAIGGTPVASFDASALTVVSSQNPSSYVGPYQTWTPAGAGWAWNG